ncbi:hypothetical protein F4823DRAFT_591274 [Ustulina deusta]|nr:hypothetical protein F4823DRAFT_591274 [Ustulina deusta]
MLPIRRKSRSIAIHTTKNKLGLSSQIVGLSIMAMLEYEMGPNQLTRGPLTVAGFNSCCLSHGVFFTALTFIQCSEIRIFPKLEYLQLRREHAWVLNGRRARKLCENLHRHRSSLDLYRRPVTLTARCTASEGTADVSIALGMETNPNIRNMEAFATMPKPSNTGWIIRTHH